MALQYRAHQVVYVDESASNERGLDRRWGWSPRGTAYLLQATTGLWPNQRMTDTRRIHKGKDKRRHVIWHNGLLA